MKYDEDDEDEMVMKCGHKGKYWFMSHCTICGWSLEPEKK